MDNIESQYMPVCKIFITTAIVLSTISSALAEETVTGSKPYSYESSSGMKLCRKINSKPQIIVCVGGEAGDAPIPTTALKEAASSLRKLSKIYKARIVQLPKTKQIMLYDEIPDAVCENEDDTFVSSDKAYEKQ